jgi:hypothetical protein
MLVWRAANCRDACKVSHKRRKIFSVGESTPARGAAKLKNAPRNFVGRALRGVTPVNRLTDAGSADVIRYFEPTGAVDRAALQSRGSLQ